jgi:hypothetical protein
MHFEQHKLCFNFAYDENILENVIQSILESKFCYYTWVPVWLFIYPGLRFSAVLLRLGSGSAATELFIHFLNFITIEYIVEDQYS